VIDAQRPPDRVVRGIDGRGADSRIVVEEL
jgi:hypothetical protein